MGRLPFEKRRPGVGNTKSEPSSSALERASYTIPEICFRNHISRPKYHRLRAEGRGPAETRFGLNTIRVTAEAEREWLRRLQNEPGQDFETKAIERAVKAGAAAIKSARHVSKRSAVKRVHRKVQAGEQPLSQRRT
jgi:hypothetical protein